jgi:hypothetical protein
MMSLTDRVLAAVGALLVAVGVVVLLVPGRYWLTPADADFLGSVPRAFWGVALIVVGVFALYATTTSPRFVRPAAYLAAVACLVWAVIELYPAFKGHTWSVTAFLLWLCLAVVCVVALPNRRHASAP